MGLDAIRQYPFLELARMPAFLLEIPNFSRFLHLVRTIFHFFQNTMRIRRKGQILRPTPNTAPLICGACYNTQPEDLLTMA